METLIAELAREEYERLSDTEAAARLNAPVPDLYGPIDIDWLEAMLLQTGTLRRIAAAADGTLPASEATEQQQAQAVDAAWSLYHYISSARQHPVLDLGIAEVAGGLQLLVLCGVVPQQVAAAALARGAVTRAAQLGLGPVTRADVSKARRQMRGAR